MPRRAGPSDRAGRPFLRPGSGPRARIGQARARQRGGGMPRVRVTRRLHFSAAHRLAREDWTEERNRAVFGLCASPNWHGHNYELDVTVEGESVPETGTDLDRKAQVYLAGTLSAR